jgi:hypothetical protein
LLQENAEPYIYSVATQTLLFIFNSFTILPRPLWKRRRFHIPIFQSTQSTNTSTNTMSSAPVVCAICFDLLTSTSCSCPDGHTFCLPDYQSWESECNQKGKVFRCPVCKIGMVRTLPRSQTSAPDVDLDQILGDIATHQLTAPRTHRRRRVSSVSSWIQRRRESVSRTFSRSHRDDRYQNQGMDASSFSRVTEGSHEQSKSERPNTSAYGSNHDDQHPFRPQTSQALNLNPFESHFRQYQQDRRQQQSQVYGVPQPSPPYTYNINPVPAFNNFSFGRAARRDSFEPMFDITKAPDHTHRSSSRSRSRAPHERSRRPARREDDRRPLLDDDDDDDDEF